LTINIFFFFPATWGVTIILKFWENFYTGHDRKEKITSQKAVVGFKNNKTAIALNHKSQKSDRIQKQQDSDRPFSIINNNKTAITLG